MKVSAWTLWLSAFGGAAAWSAALLVVPTLGSARCLGSSPTAPVARFGTEWWIMTLLTCAAFVGACYALAVTVRVLRQPRSADEGERVRFMAFGGLLLNTVFIMSLGFFAAALFLAPVCQ